MRQQLASANDDIAEKKKYWMRFRQVQIKKENLSIVNDELSMKLIEMEQINLKPEMKEFSKEELMETQARSIEYKKYDSGSKSHDQEARNELSEKKY